MSSGGTIGSRCPSLPYVTSPRATGTRTASAAALALSAVLLLAGCGMSVAEREETSPGAAESSASPSSAPSSAPTSDAAPAAGERVSGTGYSFTVPEGWGVPSADLVPAQADVFAVDLTDVEDGFSDNVNVLLSPAGAITPEQVESLGTAELEANGATEVAIGERITVAGSESAHLSAMLEQQGVQYAIEQYYATDAGQTHVVTFSFSPSVEGAQRAEIAESVLATWSWD